jgi:glucose-6-phosphate 1-epimerase
MGTAAISVDLPGSVAVVGSEPELARLQVATPLVTAEVYLHGAHVSSWTPAGERPVIWMSRTSAFERAKAIRGGVPICFPWFGPGRSSHLSPAHGFARLADWALVSAVDLDGVVTLTFRLTEADVAGLPGAQHWPHSFEATYVVILGAELTLSLTVRNTGTEEFSYEEALHSYLAVEDVTRVAVEGLHGDRYLDKTTGADGYPVQNGPVTISGETDRVYYAAGPATLNDPVAGRKVRVAKYGSSNTVVWNPWQTKAAAMGDFDDDGWQHMVCVETANALDFAISLRPGAAHAMAVRYTLDPL